MKKIIFLSFAALLFAATTHAQSTDTTANKAHKAWHKHGGNKGGDADFYKKLNLSADQQTQLKAIKDDQKTKAAAIKSNTSLSADEKKQQLKALNKDAYEKRQAVYTPEQKELIKEDHQKNKG